MPSNRPDPASSDEASSPAGIYRYREVDAQLSTAGQPSEAQLRGVAAAGFERVVNLALHDDPRYSLPDEAGLARALGLDYVHIPVAFAAPRQADLRAFFAAMEAQGGRRTLVHCAANLRVSAFLGLYRVMRLGWPRERAFALMRSLWEPDAVWSAFIDATLAQEGRANGVRG
jgi:protein tyrosine phosphatase (PTP) superfamily phosphohydrolase (DUF442 family)